MLHACVYMCACVCIRAEVNTDFTIRSFVGKSFECFKASFTYSIDYALYITLDYSS